MGQEKEHERCGGVARARRASRSNGVRMRSRSLRALAGALLAVALAACGGPDQGAGGTVGGGGGGSAAVATVTSLPPVVTSTPRIIPTAAEVGTPSPGAGGTPTPGATPSVPGVVTATPGAPTPSPTARATPAPVAPPNVTAIAVFPTVTLGGGGGRSLDPEQRRAVLAARRALGAQRGGESARLVSIEDREWPDGSLGCPQPGMVYPQVITPGYLVVLEAGGTRHAVHTDLQGRTVVCEARGPLGRRGPVILRVTRSGGIAGRTTELTVRPDGAVEVGGRRGTSGGRLEAALPPEAVTAVRALVGSAAWRRLDESYGRPVPDGFIYTVEAGGKTVTAYQGAELPEVLDNVLAAVASLWREAAATRE